MSRRFGRSVEFIGILEFQKSGLAHFHVLFGIFIPQAFLSKAWQAVGGGRIVDIRYVEVGSVVAYLTTYLTGRKILHTLQRLPIRARIFTSSRGLRLSPRKESNGWRLDTKEITALHRAAVDPTGERYEPTILTGTPELVAFESTDFAAISQPTPPNNTLALSNSGQLSSDAF